MTRFEKAFARISQYVEQKFKEDRMPGLALAITDRGQTLFLSTCGYADVAAKSPVTVDTLFEIGSIGKSFTAIALLQLHEAGLIDVHKPVTEYLPWFKVQSKFEPITLHHLMSHTAAVIRGTELSGEAYYEAYALRDTHTGAPPGTYFHYSNAGYKVLGVILETLLNQGYGDIIRERILKPLDMDATDPIITHDSRKRMAVGYIPFYDDRPPSPERPLVPARWLETATGDGCIASTISDMAVYLRMFINGGRPGVLSETACQQMTKPVIAVPRWGGAGYGYGLIMAESEGCQQVGHGGGMVGYISQITADVDSGFGVVLLTNCVWGDLGGMTDFALKTLRAALQNQDLPPIPSAADPTCIENAADYAGTYRSGEKTLKLVAEEGRLLIEHKNQKIPLEPRGADHFYIHHPDFSRFLLSFGRESDDAQEPGKVVEAFYGAEWYTGEGYSGPQTFDHPEAWNAYPGHYHSHNPWLTGFRVVLRKGQLVMIYPPGNSEPLVPLDDGSFRVGDEEQSPERIRFDTLLNGKTLRANLSCENFYRFFTP